MKTLTLIYETNAQTGLPALRVLEGSAGAMSDAELRELERELQGHYEQLRREPASIVRVRSKQYQVENQEPNGSRQPTLLIRPVSTNGSMPAGAHGKSPPPSWADGFYGALAKLAGDTALPRLEAHALQAAVEELQAGVPSDAGLLAAMLMASHLALSEQLCRGSDEDRAGMYALALRVLGRVMTEGAREDRSGWWEATSAARTEISPETVRSHWLWRSLGRLIGLPTGGPSPT
jgi:hypothetical protein